MFFLKQGIKMSVIAIALAFGTHCGGEGGAPDASERVFEGLVTGMEARTLLDLESIEVTDDAGTSLAFRAGGLRFAEFTPGHVREHMIQGLGVIVAYRESEDGTLYIVSIRDRPP